MTLLGRALYLCDTYMVSVLYTRSWSHIHNIEKHISRGLMMFLNLLEDENTGLEETQAGIKIAGRNINNLRYADDTTLMAESEEELKSLLMKVKVQSEKVGLKLNI